ncbi:hypothetical protein FDECE_15530, partial [Fusarium decemcellulare]
MKATTLVASFVFTAVVNAWKLDFYGVGTKYVKTHGTRDVDCNNLISSYDVRTDLIDFDQATAHWKDPSTFTAYQSKHGFLKIRSRWLGSLGSDLKPVLSPIILRPEKMADLREAIQMGREIINWAPQGDLRRAKSLKRDPTNGLLMSVTKAKIAGDLIIFGIAKDGETILHECAH